MKNNNTFSFLASLLFLLCFCGAKVFAGNSRLYVATDKETYSPSESVQFQIFFLNAPNSNKTIYTELLDCKGNRLVKKMLPLTSGISWGNITIPKADTAAFYVLYCYVISNDTVEVDCAKKIYIKRNGTNETAGNGKEAIINYFIESGHFVCLMPNKLLISFKDEFGNPLTGNGKITDSKNYEVSSFTIDENGYATTSFKPDFDVNYFIAIKNKLGQEIRKALPLASSSGVNLTVTTDKDSLTYTAYSLTGDKDLLDYKLEIMLDGKTIYKSDINFVLGFSVIRESISLQSLQGGFLSFRLTDTKNKLHAQRIIYNSTAKKEDALLKIIDTINKKTATVNLPAYVSGYSYLNILKKGLSTDPANRYFKDLTNEPVIFIDPANGISLNDFLISIDKEPALPAAKQPGEKSFLTLQGVAYNSEGKLLKNKDINLVFLRKNSKKDYKVVTTDRNGNFEISSLIFYDTVKVYYQLADKSDEKNDIRIELKVVPAASYSGNASKYVQLTCANNSDKTITTGTKNEYAINIPDSTPKQGKTLQEVVVKGKKEKPKSETQKFIDEYVSAQNNQTNLLRNEFDFIANPQVIDSRPLFNFLQGRFKLDIKIDARGSVKISTTSGDGVGVYLDDMDITGDLDMVTYLQVKDVALVRYYSLPLKPRLQSTNTKYSAFGTGGGGSGGDLMIYTKRGFEPTEQTVKGLPKTVITGYNPDDPVNIVPDPGTSQSLFWKSNWEVKKTETIYIGLPAAESDKKFQLIIEGINQEQLPFTFRKNLVFN